MKRSLCVYLFISVLASSLMKAQMTIEDELYASVLGIEGRTHLERGEFIKDQLHKMNVGYFTEPFTKMNVEKNDTVIIEGENIIARLGHGMKNIVISAHYDAFHDSPGANDNGSGVAVLLTLIRHLQNTEWNYTVDFCFFDQEEQGLIGSSFYVQQFTITQRHLAMINLDIEGSGEEIFVGPVGRNSQFLMQFIHESARRTGFPVIEHAEYPASDNESFSKFQLENISISIVPKGDADRLSKFVHNGYKADSSDAPKVFTVIHTVDDRSNLVSSEALKMSYEFAKTLLVLLNNARR